MTQRLLTFHASGAGVAALAISTGCEERVEGRREKVVAEVAGERETGWGAEGEGVGGEGCAGHWEGGEGVVVEGEGGMEGVEVKYVCGSWFRHGA